jgi:hypothetical protein
MHRIILPIVFSMLPLAAQTDRAALTGVVLDPSRSVVPNARVSLHAEATGLSCSSVTNSAGVYTISGLSVGQYTATITGWI